ncbi:MAG TPA: YncE family protein [Candidatus Nanoarchaeia archaeon]|nr:YncE family protein [Candidatus Nanoarchaeia archaeon]
MVRKDIVRTRILGSMGIVFCIVAVILITGSILQSPAAQQTIIPSEEAKETIQESNITNVSVLPTETIKEKQKLLYILHRSESLFSIVDLDKNETRKEIVLGKSPQEMFFDAKTNRMYITNQLSNTITVIDLKKEEVLQTFKAGNSPEGIVVTDQKIYVTNPSEDTVVVLDKNLGFIEKDITIGDNPGSMFLSQDQRKIYVLNRGSNDITIINTDINAFIDTWFAGDHPEHFAMSPYEKFIYVTSLNGLVTIIPVKQHKDYREMQVGLGASEIAFTPNNVLAVITNTDENTISLTSLTREMLLGTIDVGVSPSDVVITQEGNIAYVSNADSNTISVIELGQKIRTAEFSVGKDPQQLILREN